MKIILETALEGTIWDVMVAAHYKWEKNHGDTLQEQMDWYLKDLFKEEIDGAKKAEVQRRVRQLYPEAFLLEKEKEERINEAVTEADATREELEEEFQWLEEEAGEMEKSLMEYGLDEEINYLVYTFLRDPGKLTVIKAYEENG
ncbi:MAG: hypothetical protein ACYC2T_11385 [Bacillota bacterium]